MRNRLVNLPLLDLSLPFITSFGCGLTVSEYWMSDVLVSNTVNYDKTRFPVAIVTNLLKEFMFRRGIGNYDEG